MNHLLCKRCWPESSILTRAGVICIIVLFGSILSHGQEPPKPVISEIEFLTGVQGSRPLQEDGNTKADKVKFGPSFNIGIVHHFAERFGLALSIQYESKGMKFDAYQDNDGAPPERQHTISKQTFKYVTGTLTPKWYPFKTIGLYAGAGPYFGYMLSASYDTKIYINEVPILQRGGKLPSTEFREFDFGVSAVLGYEYSINEKIRIASRICYALALQPVTSSGRYEYTNNSLSLQFGVSFLKPLRMKL